MSSEQSWVEQKDSMQAEAMVGYWVAAKAVHWAEWLDTLRDQRWATWMEPMKECCSAALKVQWTVQHLDALTVQQLVDEKVVPKAAHLVQHWVYKTDAWTAVM